MLGYALDHNNDHLGNIASLTSGMSLHELLGDVGCFIYWAAIMVFLVTQFTSSFCMALFRWINIIHIEKALLMGTERVKQLVWWVEITISGILYSLAPIMYIYGSNPVSMTFSYNESKTFLDVLAQHKDPSGTGQIAHNIFLTVVQSLGILEMIMYVVMFAHLWLHDQTMKDSISKEHLRKRNKNNIITLTGQAWTFVIEVVVMAVITIAYNLDMDSVFLQPQIGGFYMVMGSTAISIGQFVASPDMRRFYNFMKTEP